MKTLFTINKYVLAAWMVYAVLQKTLPGWGNTPPPMEKHFLDALKFSGYVYPSVIIIQGLLAISILIKRFEFLMLIVMVPITFNIVMLHVTLAPENILKTILLLLVHSIALYEYRDRMKLLLK
jgi:hypothetical protein